MIHSMTGFGDASGQHAQVDYTVEIRSVNNRYFKFHYRSPEVLSTLETSLELLVRRHIRRGSVTLTVVMKEDAATGATQLNEEVLATYLAHVKTIQDRAQSVLGQSADQAMTLDAGAILTLPGLLVAPDPQAILKQSQPVVLDLAEQACQKLVAMRAREGQTIVDDLMGHHQQIVDQLDAVKDRVPMVLETYTQKLHARIAVLLAKSDVSLEESDLMREVAIFAEKCDTSEELQRLEAHLVQMRSWLLEPHGDPIGRTLDFLAQELLREANTIASKSNDVEICRVIVAIKGAIDRIKEQVQNLE